MLISMTGFGRFLCEASFGRLVLELQSVNRKHLEMNISLPKELGRFELKVRKWIGEAITRGQVSVRCTLKPSEETLAALLPDAGALKSYKDSWVKIARFVGCDEREINLSFLLERFPAAFDADSSVREEVYLEALKECLDGALSELTAMKQSEGKALERDLLSRWQGLVQMLREIETLAPDASLKLREKLKERLSEVLRSGAELDERLLREVAFFAERVDIAEEITRLHSHIVQFQDIVRSKESQVGRKLEFLLQEFGREINTIGSKSSDPALSKLVVEFKSELEKMREQIQNVE
jgi:uncharacterized protein (TIGR00255 family)